jgi:hypothetical protein
MLTEMPTFEEILQASKFIFKILEMQSACNYKIKTYYAGKKQKGGCKRNPNRGPCGKCLAVTLFRITIQSFHSMFFFINILVLLIISKAMSFFLNFYENLKFFKMFKFLFFKWF